MSGWKNDACVAAVYDRRSRAYGTGGHRPPLQLLLAVICALLAFSACSKRAASSQGQILRISQRNEPATLDPQLATLPDEFFIIRALSEGLVTPNPAGGPPLPAMAERWEISPDGLAYTFHLRAAQWSNGDPVTAADFVYSVHRVLSPALAAPRAALFFPLKNAGAYYRGDLKDFTQVGASAPDAHTLMITLEHPAADFLALAASGPWIPVHPATVERLGRDWYGPGNFVGNGPFTLSGSVLNQIITVTPNAKYWDAAAVRLAGIHFLSFDNGDSEERAFRAGQLDVTMAVPNSKLDTYRAATPLVLRTVPLHETRYLALNTARPPLNDVRVRRALSLALDRNILVEKVLKSGQQAAFSFVRPGLGGYRAGAALTENAVEARRLLAEAGFPEGRGFPKLELTTWPVSTPQLEALQQMWRHELGIEVALVQREARTHLAALAIGDYDLGFATAIPDYDSPSDLLDRLTGGSPSNYAHWHSAEFDRLVAGAGRSGTAVARNTAYQQAEKVLLDEMPLIPLYFNAKNFLLQPAVQGWREDALWTRFYKNVYLSNDPPGRL